MQTVIYKQETRDKKQATINNDTWSWSMNNEKLCQLHLNTMHKVLLGYLVSYCLLIFVWRYNKKKLERRGGVAERGNSTITQLIVRKKCWPSHSLIPRYISPYNLLLLPLPLPLALPMPLVINSLHSPLWSLALPSLQSSLLAPKIRMNANTRMWWGLQQKNLYGLTPNNLQYLILKIEWALLNQS